jgi:hypothetical protein
MWLLLQVLKTLRGVAGQLPLGLPPQIETLEYSAEPASDDHKLWRINERLPAAVARIGQLQKLRELTVPRCWGALLPISIVRQLPATVQVRAAVVSGYA